MLLKDGTRNDSLLLRLALAESNMPELFADYQRTKAISRHGSMPLAGAATRSIGREEARYALELAQDRVAALKLARENWEVQREAADLRILVAGRGGER
jgi:hypothetical protein